MNPRKNESSYGHEVAAKFILAEAIEKYDPAFVFALFSGGHDSLCSTTIASEHPRFSGCVYVNTGTGIPQTTDFVRETCARNGWPLKEYSPPKGSTYRELVLKHGFPGPGSHSFMYINLKERALRQLKREHRPTPRAKLMFVTGVRQQESARRMGHVEEVRVEGREVWVAPLTYWGPIEKHAFIESRGLPRNQVVEVLCMSGECLCGAFARPGEIKQIEQFYPATAAAIHALERDVAAQGKPAVWGTRPPGSKRREEKRQLALCYSCESKFDRETMPMTLIEPEIRG